LELPVIAVVVGHNESAQGADALEPIGMSEFRWNSLIAERMVDLGSRHGFRCVKFLRKPAKSYTTELAAVYKAVNASGAIASIELHFNDAGPTATGTETLVSESAASHVLGQFVQSAMVRKLGLPDRNVKVVPRGARGSASVYYGSMPGILVEPFFGGNRSDVARAAGIGIQGFAEMYLEGLQNWALSRA
jgi:N-acetylmuramoyl-L-alanine amidase